MRNKFKIIEILKIVEWFGGIGASTTAIKRLLINHKLVDYVELNKHAVKSFNLLNNTEFEPTDIEDVNVNGYGEIDLLVAGWPCQDLSFAGKQKGLIDSERSSLIWTTIKKVKKMKIKPRVILLENVKGLLNKKHKEAFDVIMDEFQKLGYFFSWKLLNAKYFGVPQSRERVYCVLTRDKKFDWTWSEKFNTVDVKFKEILDENVKWEKAENFGVDGKFHYINKVGKDLKIKSSYTRYWSIEDSYVGTVTATVPPKIYKKEADEIFYRKASSLESFRLMGFNDNEYNKLVDNVSHNQISKQAGNSIVVNVLVEIFRELFVNQQIVNQQTQRT